MHNADTLMSCLTMDDTPAVGVSSVWPVNYIPRNTVSKEHVRDMLIARGLVVAGGTVKVDLEVKEKAIIEREQQGARQSASLSFLLASRLPSVALAAIRVLSV
jgi:hypothetical protein